MFKYAFPTVSAIPLYQRYNLYTMPSNFYQLNKVVLKGNVSNSQQYQNTTDFYWEQRNVIAINYYNVGEYSISYFAYPQDITDLTANTYEFEVDIEAQEAIPYYAAAHVLMDEQGKKDVSNSLLAIYNNKLANLDTKLTTSNNGVENTLFSGAGTNRLYNRLF